MKSLLFGWPTAALRWVDQGGFFTVTLMTMQKLNFATALAVLMPVNRVKYCLQGRLLRL